MASSYNSKLIANLYSSTRSSEIIKILEEMREIADPVFIYPIYMNWLRYNDGFSFFSHYFISALSEIDSQDLIQIAKKIIKESKSVKDAIWCLPILTKYSEVDEEIITIAKKVLINYSNLIPGFENLTDFNMIDLLEFFVKNSEFENLLPELRKIAVGNEYEYDIRKITIRYLFKHNASQSIQFFIANYSSVKSDDMDILLAKEILLWKGPLTDTLRKLLMEKAVDRAREILIADEKKKELEKKQEKDRQQEKEKNRFPNIMVVNDIIQLRKKINTSSISNPHFLFKLLADDESLINQQELVSDKEALISRCVDLRTSFKGISEETKKHAISEIEIEKIIPNIRKEDYSKPLNRLILYIYSKKIKVDVGLYGLRNLNRIVNLITHPEQEKELVECLKKDKLYDLYTVEDWQTLHKKFLEVYKKALESLLNAILAQEV